MLLVLLAVAAHIVHVSSQTPTNYCPVATRDLMQECGAIPTKAECCADFAKADLPLEEYCVQCCAYDPQTCNTTPPPPPSTPSSSSSTSSTSSTTSTTVAPNTAVPSICERSGARLFKIKYRGASGQFELRSACGGKNEKFSIKLTGITEIECISGKKTTNKIPSFTQPQWNTIRDAYQGQSATRIEYTNTFNVRGNSVNLRFETIFFDNSTANLTYGNDTVEVPLYGLKFSFSITGWKFTASNDRCLDVGLMISSNGASTQYQSNEGNSVNVRFSDTISIKNPKSFLIDGNTAQNHVTITSGTKKINYLLDLGMERGNVITYDPVVTGNFASTSSSTTSPPNNAFMPSIFVAKIIGFIGAFFAVIF